MNRLISYECSADTEEFVEEFAEDWVGLTCIGILGVELVNLVEWVE